MSLYGLVRLITQSTAFQALAAQTRTPRFNISLGLPRSARPLTIAALWHSQPNSIVYVASSVEGSRTVAAALNNILGDDTAVRLTEPNTAFYDIVAPAREVITQRSQVLARLAETTDGGRRTTDFAVVRRPPSAVSAPSPIIVTSPRALMHPTLPLQRFKALSQTLKRDATLALEQTLQHWVEMGYESEPVVERIGTFSRRGGILDVWSPAHPSPARIELFGNTIDSMRYFDPGTQRSGEQLVTVTITPLETGVAEADAPPTSLLDYIGSNVLLILDDEDELRDAWESLEAKAEREREMLAKVTGSNADDDNAADDEASDWTFLEDKVGADSTPAAIDTTHRLPYLSWDAFNDQRKTVGGLILGQAVDDASLTTHPFARQFSPAPHFAGQISPLLEYLQGQMAGDDGRPTTDDGRGFSTIVVSRQGARLAEVWSEKHSTLAAQSDLTEIPQGSLTFAIGALPEGFVWTRAETTDDGRRTADPAVVPASEPRRPSSRLLSRVVLLTDAEIYGHVKPESFMRGKVRKSSPERAFADWQLSDAVVHEDYGVGIFRGLMHLTVNTGTSVEPVEGEREYLLLEYADADRLYVPLHQLDRVSRYIGTDDSRPNLDKLGSGSWTTAKQKAKGAAADMAREMLQLYAAREIAQRPAFSADTPWQYELESSFPYVETEDQLRAIQDVKSDMQGPEPMDRLVVGDVGFGKTEVALRAAFKAVQDQKQVAVLVPTTILAQQHWNTFTRRIGAYPVEIEMLSRFRTAKEKKEVLEGLKDGTIDIVIGTHGLVADRVMFKNLGLLIIDEEQRFGIKAKEKLKKLRAEVDVLTLTATPIPRTLYMGLSGIRDISRIETPPAERLPIINYIGAWDDVVVQQAIRREMDRSGQIFFVHNRINTIGLVEQKLKRLVPDATMSMAHGQMDERDLARIMTRFADGQLDILLCTNIIESGLDIPNANTIIIDNADHFGLAELHQLRGRVGRSTIQAYSYFLHDRRRPMTSDARERLETLREVTGIGAGYAIAMRDLELRGAGDILGPKQSGQIAAVGFDLYTRLLSRQVATLRAMRDGTPMPENEPTPVVIDLPLAVGLPESYIQEDQLRMQIYRRAASLASEDQVREFEDELDERFGKLPPTAKNLTYQIRLKMAATQLKATSITTDGNRFTIRAPVLEHMNRARLERVLGEDCIIGRTQVIYSRSGTPEQWKAKLMDIVKQLVKLANATAQANAKAAAQPAPPRAAPEDKPPEPDAPRFKPIGRDDDW